MVALAARRGGAAAAPAAALRGTNDAGGFRDVLPPGTNGLANAPAARWRS